MDSNLWILLNPASDQVHKHSETALDTLKKEGTESSFPVKMHLIPGKTPAICEFLVVQNSKEKSQILENQRLEICYVPRAKAPLLLYIKVQIDLTA